MERPYSATIRFVMALELSPEEIESVESIQHHACAIMGLVNDYWSWPKEKATDMRIMNAVTVLMRVKGIGEQEAHDSVKALAIEYECKLMEM